MIDLTVLTHRELEVVGSILKHANCDKCADELVITRSTLGTHLSSIYQKLRVHSLPELQKLFYECKIKQLKAERMMLSEMLKQYKEDRN